MPTPPDSPADPLTEPAAAWSAPHAYVSTACLHGRHDDCRRTCKYCSAPCQHPAHASQPDGDPAAIERAILDAAWLRLYRRDPLAAADALAEMRPPAEEQR